MLRKKTKKLVKKSQPTRNASAWQGKTTSLRATLRLGKEKQSVKKVVVKKLVKKVIAKAKAKKKSGKTLKSVLAVQPKERMITLADLFREEAPVKTAERVTLASILEESIGEMKSEDKEITLADLFEDVKDEKPAVAANLETLTLADLFSDEPQAQAAAEAVTLADLFENFDWDKVVSEVHAEAKTSAEAVFEKVEAQPAPTSTMFHSIETPEFEPSARREPSLIARLFAPQMLATVGITMVSLFFVSLWFQATKASVTETSLQDPALIGAWEAVKDGYHKIQTQKNQVQNSIEQLNSAKQLQDAQNAISQAFGQAMLDKINQSAGGAK